MTIVTRLDYERDHSIPASPPGSHFGAVSLADLAVPQLDGDYLIKGILSRNEVSLLVGPSGSGKSFLATDLSMRVARGVDYLPVHAAQRIFMPKVKRGGVVYLAGEGARGLRRRLAAYLLQHGLDGVGVPFVLLTRPIDLHTSDEHAKLLIEEIKSHGSRFVAEQTATVELVVIDTLSASSPGANENASEDMSRILGRCQWIVTETKAAVLLVHHMNATGQRERGHSSLRANVDSVIEVSRPEDSLDAEGRSIRLAKLTKQKDGEDGLVWRFVLRKLELGNDADGDVVTSCVVEPPSHSRRVEGAAFEFKGANARLIFDALLDALCEHGQAPPADVDRCPRATPVVHIDHWKTMYERRAPPKEDERKRADAIRKAMERALVDFQNYRLIGADSPYVWLTGKPVCGFDLRQARGSKSASDRADAGSAPRWEDHF